jgi:hypothetical protein
MKANLAEALKAYMDGNLSLHGLATLLLDGSMLHHIAVNGASMAALDLAAKALVLEDDASVEAAAYALFFSPSDGIFPRLWKALGVRGQAFFSTIRVFIEQNANT